VFRPLETGGEIAYLTHMKLFLILLSAFALTASAADISGTWKGTAEGPQGAIQRSFTFHQDGSKLTGETNSEFTGKSAITDGKVEGDAISFSITANIQGNEIKLSYQGKISGETIKLTSNFGDQSIEWTLKKGS
jgi:hypothetical protein